MPDCVPIGSTPMGSPSTEDEDIEGLPWISQKKMQLTRLQLRHGVPCDPELHWLGVAERVRRTTQARAVARA